MVCSAWQVMFFYRNKHIMIDLGTGNNNKITWPFHDKQEFIDVVETVYRGARKGVPLGANNPRMGTAVYSNKWTNTPIRGGRNRLSWRVQRALLATAAPQRSSHLRSRAGRGLVVSPKDYSTKYKY